MGALSRWKRPFEFPTPPQRAVFGFDHGVGHPLLLLCNTNAHNHRKSEGFKHLDNYSEWPKVADVVSEAVWNTPNRGVSKTERDTNRFCCAAPDKRSDALRDLLEPLITMETCVKGANRHAYWPSRGPLARGERACTITAPVLHDQTARSRAARHCGRLSLGAGAASTAIEGGCQRRRAAGVAGRTKMPFVLLILLGIARQLQPLAPCVLGANVPATSQVC